MIWKDIPGYGNYYQASSCGKIRAKERIVKRKHPKTLKIFDFKYRQRELKLTNDVRGYRKVSIGYDNVCFAIQVGRLVLLAHKGLPPFDGAFCRHLNDDPSDNRIENLAWGSQLDNMADRKTNKGYAVGEFHPMAKLTKEQVIEIYSSTESSNVIAKRYGMKSRSKVSDIRRGLLWSSVTKGL